MQVLQLLGHLMQDWESVDLMKPLLHVVHVVAAVARAQMAQSPTEQIVQAELSALLTYPLPQKPVSHPVFVLEVQFMQFDTHAVQAVEDCK